ncbi:hypothetical protein HA402_003541 [Bradysia odoriphaga]|nr:hypothetical protein HA402_003541 [Bradysia odoriphaga]
MIRITRFLVCDNNVFQVRHIDYITTSKEENDKCKLLNYEIPKISFHGGGTYTFGALKEARDILSKARKHSRKLVCLITDGFSNGKNPVPIAQKLKNDNITIITFGIQSGNSAELYNISSSPGASNSFLLDSFTQFESLARKALHSDYKVGHNIKMKDSSFCDILCDKPLASNGNNSCCDANATCTCGTTSGHYKCMCSTGYYGSGLVGECHCMYSTIGHNKRFRFFLLTNIRSKVCPNGTYWHNFNFCKPCPDVNHITVNLPAVNASYCVCKSGFIAQEDNRCEVIKCPKLEPPENGYFVKHPTTCGHVLNAACGARCKSGYQFSGSSIRLCQENGTWSGVEANCFLKTCPQLQIPYYGMTTCKNSDLNIFYDYTPRNKTFMEMYDSDEHRKTEPLPIDTDCNFKCGPGFYLVGSAIRNCLPLSKWDGLQTTCKQILCPALPKIAFGEYEPTDCSEQKIAHGFNCTIICPFGFEVKGGPAVKTCGGKRTGVWSNKNKSPKCIDVSPPTIECPENFTVFMESDRSYSIVKEFPQPNVTGTIRWKNCSTFLSFYIFFVLHCSADNSDLNVTFWIKPAIKAEGVKLTLGNHIFTYIAIDSFKNKARCNFTVNVIDRTPPVMDNCFDPPEFLIPTCNANGTNLEQCYIEWEDPIIYDNSNTELMVLRNLDPGFLDIGQHRVVYNVTDNSGNSGSCVMNITVKRLECNVLASPSHGQSICAKNQTHTWCEVACDFGYAIYDELEDSHLENFKLICENNFAKWKYDIIPDCTELQLPNYVEQIFSIALDSEQPLCGDNSTKDRIEDDVLEQVKAQMCAGQTDCEVTSTIPECVDEMPIINSNNSNSNATFYSIVKRDVSERTKRTGKLRQKSNLKIRVLTKVGKKLGLWNENTTRSENIKKIKTELKNLGENKELLQKLEDLKINIRLLKLEESVNCKNGSVAKKNLCVQCPKGSFHNVTLQICQQCPLNMFSSQHGQTLCTPCPMYHSTRKLGSHSATDCKQQCPPGTVARLKAPRNNRSNQKFSRTLMPFCRKCSPGEYQSNYDQIACDQCPPNSISTRGSTSVDNCHPKQHQPCSQINVCGLHGTCKQEISNPFLYSCSCEDGFVGSHCEHQLDLCLSAPCHNGGTCYNFQNTSSSIVCTCPVGFSGTFCENSINQCNDSICLNGGWCVETNESPFCECLSGNLITCLLLQRKDAKSNHSTGFVGERCEIEVNFCSDQPCESGTCISTTEGYYCQCPPGIIGRRCTLRPCDYVPCHENAICVDLMEFPASRSSFVCRCPKGLRGYDCSQIENPCEKMPCLNNARCVPLALRDKKTVDTSNADESIYEKYRCECPPYFYGEKCEILTTPDFVMEFRKSGINDYVEVAGMTERLSEISVCTWMQTDDNFNYGTVISYATESVDNMFTLTDYNGLVLYVNGSNIVTDVNINDGLWHFICVAWTRDNGFYEIHVDGSLHHTGYNLSENNFIESNGVFVIGQEQDSIGTSFSESESYVGKIAYLDIWNRFLSSSEVLEYYSSCEPYHGNLYAWSDFKNHIKGDIKIAPSPFCKPCTNNIHISNGFIRNIGNRAFHYCHDGYKLEGPIVRDCLRTSKWSLPIPYCRSIRCGYLPTLNNGVETIEKTTFGEEVTYTCNDGYRLASGSQKRVCMINGTWSGTHPECISNIQCYRLEPPENAKITYANERGMISDTLEKYSMGTFAEIQCDNDLVVEGENFLSCSENTQWDYPLPKCVIKAATEDVPIESSTLNTNFGMTDDADDISVEEEDDDLIVATPKAPTMAFWQSLKKFLYQGCSQRNTSSELCWKISKSVEFSDLTTFQPPETNDHNMDTILVGGLHRCVNHLNNYSFAQKLTFENVFDCITNAESPSAMSKDVKDLLRLIVCFYIDTISLVTVPTDDAIKPDESITDQIKRHLMRIVTTVFQNYVRDASYDTEGYDNSTRATEIKYESECNLMLIPTTLNTSIKNVTNHKAPLPTVDFESVRMVPVFVPEMTKVHFECARGYQIIGKDYTECLFGEWTEIGFDCEQIYCDYPPQPMNMDMDHMNDTQYAIGYKIQLKCRDGYMLYGNALIFCTSDGEWTKVMARCSKISCSKPTLPSDSTIVSSYQDKYQDKIIVKCPNDSIVEIECQSNGLWMPNLSTLCSNET